MTLEELKAKRTELRDEMVRVNPSRITSEWYADRVNELATLGRQIARIEAQAAPAR